MTNGEMPPEGQSTPASMADLKTMETSLRSSMDTQFSEIRDMLAKLASTKPPSDTLPLIEDPLHSSSGDSGDGSKKKEGDEETDTEIKNSSPSTAKPKSGKPEYHEVSPLGVYSPDPLIPHPRINPLGPPPKLNALAFTSWQHSMRSHVNSTSIELWRIIQVGYKAVDANNLTIREVVDAQLNATALNMIQHAVGTKDMPLIQTFSTANETWDALSDLFVGNESMKRNRYDALSNEAEGFYKLDGEDHEEMYRRLVSIATSFRDLGATYIDDAWIKRKYVSSLMPFEGTHLKTLQGRHNYDLMTSNQVMQEMTSFKVATKNAEDARARSIGMQKGVNLALKATVEVGGEDDFESSSFLSNEGLKLAYNEHLVLAAKGFWENPSRAKAQYDKCHFVGSPQGGKRDIFKARTCYNCQDKYHFVIECPYEKRQENGGRLILKDKSKMPPKKAYVKNKRAFFKKKAPRIVLMTQEEYPTDD